MKNRSWFVFAILTTIFWGVWGAFIEAPEKAGFPATLGYVVWSLSMIAPALFALRTIKWKLDLRKRSVVAGCLIGFTGAAGQLILFQALRMAPAYLVFPIISLSPLVTILLSILLLKEKASTKSWIGIVGALIAIPLLSYQPEGSPQKFGTIGVLLTLAVFLSWGVQGYLMRKANDYTNAESIFFYMMCMGIALVPVALGMTDFSAQINWGFKGPYLAFFIQNAQCHWCTPDRLRLQAWPGHCRQPAYQCWCTCYNHCHLAYFIRSYSPRNNYYGMVLALLSMLLLAE